jgi:hypothetical protein
VSASTGKGDRAPTGGQEFDPGEAPEPLEGGDDVRRFWSERNKRAKAKLYDEKGNSLVDDRLLASTADGIRDFEKNNPNYRVETYGPSGGLRHSGSTSNHGAQGRGMAALTGGRGAALDVVIIDKKTGKMLTNHPGKNHQNQGTVGENAPIYQELFNRTVTAGEKKYSGFSKDARFGGYFAGGSNAMDLMHIDTRGRVAPQGGGTVSGGFNEAQMRRWGIDENVGLADVRTTGPESTVAEVSEPRREVEVRAAPDKPVRYSGDSLVARAEPSESGQKVQRKMGMKNQENEVDVKKKGMTYNQYFGLDNEEAD